MKEKNFKMAFITLLVIFALIIVGLVSYIFKLQNTLLEQNINNAGDKLAQEILNEIEEDNIQNVTDDTVENITENTTEVENEDEDDKNTNLNLKRVSGKVGNYIGLDENSQVVMSEDEVGLYAGWEDIFIGACGWWCTVEGVNEEVKASSTLRNDKHINYLPNNVLDSLRTNSWVEGVDGDGIGEWIEISKQYLCSEGDKDGGRLGELCIVTGYANNEKLWKENNRVKTLLMYVDNEPYKYIELEDTIKPQFINVWDNETYQLEPSQEIKLKFEIVEVYEGAKYDDTAITYLDIDFLKGH